MPDHNTRAVGRGSGPAVRVRLVRWLNEGKPHRPHPKLRAVPAVEAVQVSRLPCILRAGDEDAPARNDGAAVAWPRKSRLPSDIFPRSPVERRFVLGRDTVPQRPAELRPIRCLHSKRQEQQQSERAGASEPIPLEFRKTRFHNSPLKALSMMAGSKASKSAQGD